MKTVRILVTVLALTLTATACVDPTISSGGGGGGSSQVVVQGLIGTWRGTTGGWPTGSAKYTEYPVTVKFYFSGTALMGSVQLEDCLSASITSGSVSRLSGTDIYLVKFTATTPGQEYEFYAGQLSADGRSLTGLAALTSNSSRCPSFDLGAASLERSS